MEQYADHRKDSVIQLIFRIHITGGPDSGGSVCLSHSDVA